MRKYELSTKFKKDIKKAQKQTSPKPDLKELKDVMAKLAADEPLPSKKRDHQLSGSWTGYRECHIQPDFLLIYKKKKLITQLDLNELGLIPNYLNKKPQRSFMYSLRPLA